MADDMPTTTQNVGDGTSEEEKRIALEESKARLNKQSARHRMYIIIAAGAAALLLLVGACL